MVDILCPHCEEEIALDDDASGEFVCPYCDGEFEWNVEPEVRLDPIGSKNIMDQRTLLAWFVK